VHILYGLFTFRQLFSPKVIWPTPRANVPAQMRAAWQEALFAFYLTEDNR
jgi:hypothetical protein